MATIYDRKPNLFLEGDLSLRELIFQSLAIYSLEKPMPKLAVNGHGGANHRIGLLIATIHICVHLRHLRITLTSPIYY